MNKNSNIFYIDKIISKLTDKIINSLKIKH